jgi:hypothetical protein
MKYLLLFALIATSGLSHADLVKQSKSGICHDFASAWFAKTKQFTAYDSVKDCLRNGGRLPRNSKVLNAAKKDNLQYSTLYNRDAWQHWVDEDRDCQDTRQEVLIAASSIKVTFKTAKQCKVKSGRWYDPFSNKTWTIPGDLDTDHIVPLAWAHGHGAGNWTKKQRRVFANDFENLLAVEDNLNQSKGAKGPDQWLPPNHKYRCEYVSRFDDMVKKYKLAYVASEKRTINKMLTKCRG